MSNDKFQNQYLVRTDAKNTISTWKLLENSQWSVVRGSDRSYVSNRSYLTDH